MSLSGFDPNLVLKHTGQVTEQIGQQRGRLFQQGLAGLSAGGALARGNRAIGVQEGILDLNKQKFQQEQQQNQRQEKAQQEFNQALRQAAQGGLPSIKQFYIEQGMPQEALKLEQAEAQTRKLGLESEKLFQDIEGTIRARGIGDAVQAVLASSENPRAQAALYKSMRKNLTKQGIDLPERPTPELLTVLANQANSVDMMGQKIANDPQLKKQFLDGFQAVYGPEGQAQAEQIAESMFSDEPAQEFQRGFNPADADPRFVNSTGPSDLVQRDTEGRGALIQQQVEAGLIDRNQLTDTEYKMAFGQEALDTKKEADRLEKANVLEEAGIDSEALEFQQALQAPLAKPQNELAGETKKSNVESKLQEILDDPYASEAQKSAAVAALAKAEQGRADRASKEKIAQIKVEQDARTKEEKRLYDESKLPAPVKTDLIKSAMSLQDNIGTVNGVIEDLTPEALTYYGKGEQWIAGQMDKLDQYSPAQRQALIKAERIRPTLGRFLASYVKDISGAAVNEAEFKRLSDSMINPNLGPQQLKIRAELLKAAMQLELEGKQYRLKHGFTEDFTEEMKKRRQELKAEVAKVFAEDEKLLQRQSTGETSDERAKAEARLGKLIGG